jgi:hypothetical protein
MAQAATVKPFRMATRHVRLLSVVGTACLLAGNLAPFLLPVDGHSMVFMALRLAGWVLATVVSVGSPGWRIVIRGELDEREHAERGRALRISHRLTGFMLAVAFIWLFAAQGRNLWLPDLAQCYWLLGLLYWMHVMLPAMLMAWRTPVEEED